MIEAYPLQWPVGWKRTIYYKRQRSKFDTTFGKARDNLLNEIRLLGGQNPIISSNIHLRLDENLTIVGLQYILNLMGTKNVFHVIVGIEQLIIFMP